MSWRVEKERERKKIFNFFFVFLFLSLSQRDRFVNLSRSLSLRSLPLNTPSYVSCVFLQFIFLNKAGRKEKEGAEGFQAAAAVAASSPSPSFQCFSSDPGGPQQLLCAQDLDPRRRRVGGGGTFSSFPLVLSRRRPLPPPSLLCLLRGSLPLESVDPAPPFHADDAWGATGRGGGREQQQRQQGGRV